jgi:hypothetical protein
MLKATARTLLIMGVLAGCYVYAPPPSGRAPDAGEEIRAVLTDAGTTALAPRLGDNVNFVDGRLEAAADSALSLSVTSTTTRLGVSSDWKGETVTIPRGYVATVQQKVLSRSRSVGMGAAALGVAVAAYIAFKGDAGVFGGRGGGSGSGHQ